MRENIFLKFLTLDNIFILFIFNTKNNLQSLLHQPKRKMRQK
jgi:hypothetical protein